MTIKKCTKCGQDKDLSYFAKQSKSPDGLAYWCRECYGEHKRTLYHEDIEKSRNYTNERRAERIQWLQELKSNIPCVDCGKIYEPYCMDYDHLPEKEEKLKGVSRMILDNTPKNIILEEIKKCDLVCLLCHNKRTHDRFNEQLGDVRKYEPNQLRNVNMINTFKSQPCAMCNIQYESYNMQIDHIDPATKLYDVCQLKNYKIETLLAELAKCQVLCALCHRKKSIIEQQDKKYKIKRPRAPKRQELFYDPINKVKECGRCHKIKPTPEFPNKKDTISGCNTYCKECFNEYRREKRKLN